MIINKSFEFRSGHIVRDCTSDRCSLSLHGHTYKAKIFIEGSALDKAGMLMDFGIFKFNIKKFVDLLDNSLMLYKEETDENYLHLADSLSANNKIITTEWNPTAENISKWFLDVCNCVIQNITFKNFETFLKCVKVELNETTSGQAIAVFDGT